MQYDNISVCNGIHRHAHVHVHTLQFCDYRLPNLRSRTTPSDYEGMICHVAYCVSCALANLTQ